MGVGLFEPLHLLLILMIALVVFGPGKLPEIGSSLGKGIREFKQSARELSEPSDAPTINSVAKAAPEQHEEPAV